jgi:hypothetical protein
MSVPTSDDASGKVLRAAGTLRTIQGIEEVKRSVPAVLEEGKGQMVQKRRDLG